MKQTKKLYVEEGLGDLLPKDYSFSASSELVKLINNIRKPPGIF